MLASLAPDSMCSRGGANGEKTAPLAREGRPIRTHPYGHRFIGSNIPVTYFTKIEAEINYVHYSDTTVAQPTDKCPTHLAWGDLTYIKRLNFYRQNGSLFIF
ncbi:hypothetical protein AVEN_236153-1 [Araneus ventricosus]|uniref:Uncharacterized protein n=1 Tax=Araneus ventricosus TaxID=182803 RepID=A0A4Y2PAG4_ARAVE|nr:hypothetical protein AVEN_236153-1 [Araneus ventricosus]